MQPRELGRVGSLAFGGVDILSAILVYLGVFVGLPTRWWPIDAPAALVIALLLGGGVGLLLRRRWAADAARAAALVTLVLGLVLVALTAVSATYLRGIYGPVGRGGAVILAMVAALALPYLVVLPAAQLVWLGPRGRGGWGGGQTEEAPRS